jgi:hypothetical protein
MKLLTDNVNFDDTIYLTNDMNQSYGRPVLFHCFWHGNLNEKHLLSIKSCYYFNVYKKRNKIILWVEDTIPNKFFFEIKKYATIIFFQLECEKKIATLEMYNPNFNHKSYYADFVRTLLLYNYGGCWFDLDCLFLRSFDPLFYNFEKDICLYTWGYLNIPNNAIYISLEAKSKKMAKNIEFIINRNKGWGFKQANLTFDLELDMLILPCSWFDPVFIKECPNIFDYTDKIYDFNNFFNGCFCYHWHNHWDKPIHNNSIINQLIRIIDYNLLLDI